MGLFEELGIDPRIEATPRGTLRVWMIPPNIFVSRAVGFVEEGHVDLFESYAMQCIRQNKTRKICGFHDWLDVSGYDSKCRKRLTAWSRAQIDMFEEIHMCLRSKILAMGVQLVNIAVNGVIKVHSERTRLEVEMRRVIRATPGAPKI